MQMVVDERWRTAWQWWCVVTIFLIAIHADAQISGDADCDGMVTGDDLAPIIARIFDPAAPACSGVDANEDAGVSVADVAAVVRILAPPPSGPVLTYFGIANAEGIRIDPSGYLAG